MRNSRRTFLKTSALGLAAVGTGVTTASAATSEILRPLALRWVRAAMSLARYPCSGSANLHPVDSFARPERPHLRFSLLVYSSNAEGDDASAVAFEFRIAL